VVHIGKNIKTEVCIWKYCSHSFSIYSENLKKILFKRVYLPKKIMLDMGEQWLGEYWIH